MGNNTGVISHYSNTSVDPDDLVKELMLDQEEVEEEVQRLRSSDQADVSHCSTAAFPTQSDGF